MVIQCFIVCIPNMVIQKCLSLYLEQLCVELKMLLLFLPPITYDHMTSCDTSANYITLYQDCLHVPCVHTLTSLVAGIFLQYHSYEWHLLELSTMKTLHVSNS